jgi:multidrug efflux pump subunit AcrA (membrane-fusion protein)
MGAILKYGLPILAVSGFAFATWRVAQAARPLPPAKPAAEPATAPFEAKIAGAGIVEARSQNIAIGTAVSGLVAAVDVQVGARVKKGDALFHLDDRDKAAELAVRMSALDSSKAELARLESLPRPEDLPPAAARVTTAESVLADAQQQLLLADGVQDKRAISIQELDRRRFAVQTAKAQTEQARADLARTKAGAWGPDLELARAALRSAEARVAAQRTEVERMVVRASIDGTVLAVNVRPGEFAQAGPSAAPLMLLGDIERMHVRVDIDENDAWRFKRGSKALAFVRGNRELSVPLEFVRVDPYVIPKRSLTGESTERVDTRVLQVLFSFDPAALPVYVGQQMDVFVESPK